MRMLHATLARRLCGTNTGNLKLTLPTAFAMLQLAWGLLASGSGARAASSYDELAWGAAYLMACQQANGTYVAQARRPQRCRWPLEH